MYSICPSRRSHDIGPLSTIVVRDFNVNTIPYSPFNGSSCLGAVLPLRLDPSQDVSSQPGCVMWGSTRNLAERPLLNFGPSGSALADKHSDVQVPSSLARFRYFLVNSEYIFTQTAGRTSQINTGWVVGTPFWPGNRSSLRSDT